MTHWELEQITRSHADPSLLLLHNSNTVETAVRPNHLINYSTHIALQFTECVVCGNVFMETNETQ